MLSPVNQAERFHCVTLLLGGLRTLKTVLYPLAGSGHGFTAVVHAPVSAMLK